MPSLWMLRAGRDCEHIDTFLNQGVVALSGFELGPLSVGMSKPDLVQLFKTAHPTVKENTLLNRAGQYLRFLAEIKPADEVLTFDRERRVYYIGTVESEYEWRGSTQQDIPHTRKVKWNSEVPRDQLGVATRNTLGAIQALFKVSSEAQKDLKIHQIPLGSTNEVVKGKDPTPAAPEVQAEQDLQAEMLEKADAFIEDAISRLNWSQLQDLVARILRAMGYRTNVTSPGSDRGVDIFASPDGLGLQEPRIYVEVKHRNGSMGSQDLRAFIGGRKATDRCLYVSTGGFTKDARYEAERAAVPLTLITLPTLRRLFVEQYERLDPETAALVPLRKVYWPIG